MTEKSSKQLASDTLNALIAGGHFPSALVALTSEGIKVDHESLRAVEAQLREYYSAGSYAPKPGKAESGPLGL